jgi:hypothetical protein
MCKVTGVARCATARARRQIEFDPSDRIDEPTSDSDINVINTWRPV